LYGAFLSSSRFGLFPVFCSERKGRSSSRRLRSGSRSARKGSRDRNASQGLAACRLAALPGYMPAFRCGRPGLWLKQTDLIPVRGSSARRFGVSIIRSATVVRQRFFGMFWPLFLAGSERLRDNRRMTDAAHNQHSETRRPSDRDRIVTTGPSRAALGCTGPNGTAVVRKPPPAHRHVTCANGVYRAGCVGPNGAVGVRK
jgi:hypothetical protein